MLGSHVAGNLESPDFFGDGACLLSRRYSVFAVSYRSATCSAVVGTAYGADVDVFSFCVYINYGFDQSDSFGFFPCIGSLAFDLPGCGASSFLEISPLWDCTSAGEPSATRGCHYPDCSIGMAVLFPSAGAKADETSAMWCLGSGCSLLGSWFWCRLASKSHGLESQRFAKLVSWMEVCLRFEPQDRWHVFGR